MKKILIGILLLLTFSPNDLAAQWDCGSDLLLMEVATDPLNNSVYEQRKVAIRNKIAQNKALQNSGAKLPAGSQYTIPVVFHIIGSNLNSSVHPEFVTDNQIDDCITMLNNGFGDLLGSTVAAKSDGQIRFCLAQNTASGATWASLGSAKPGVTRFTSAVADGISNGHYVIPGTGLNSQTDLATLVYFDNTKYLNIWIVNSITEFSSTSGGGVGVSIVGYSSLPLAAGLAPSQVIDGIVIRPKGIRPNPLPSWDLGRVIIHEAGHYFGLNHTFAGGCSGTQCSTATCLSDQCHIFGDECCDTPPESGIVRGPCSLSGSTTFNTCVDNCLGTGDLPDQCNNHMTYRDDIVRNTFTSDQVDRMQTIITTVPERTNLVSPLNLIFTGVATGGTAGAGCIINFVTPTFTTSLPQGGIVACIGTSFNLVAINYANYNYTWNTSGGNASPPNSNIVPVTFAIAGSYTVSLTITNASNPALTFTSQLTILVSNCTVNNQANANWYFGRKGTVAFNGGAHENLPSFNMNTAECNASVSNASGQLLFYTDGRRIIDNTHTVINPSSLMNGNPSSNHGVVIVPKPASTTNYFIYLTAAATAASNCFSPSANFGIAQYEVNVSAGGAVTLVGGPTHPTNNYFVGEGLTVVPANDGTEYWLLAKASGYSVGSFLSPIPNAAPNALTTNNKLLAYRITSMGIAGAPIQSTVDNISEVCGINGGGGGVPAFLNAVVVASNRKYSVFADRGQSTNSNFLYFDCETGLFNEPFKINKSYVETPYNTFSPNSNLLYHSEVTYLDQIDISNECNCRSNILGQIQTVSSSVGTQNSMDMQLGPDGNIYRINSNQPNLSVIASPNTKITSSNSNACQYLQVGVPLTAPWAGQRTLPNDIIAPTGPPADDFKFCSSNCGTVRFAALGAGTTFSWDFGDFTPVLIGTNSAIPVNTNGNSGNYEYPVHVYANPGTYTVKLTITSANPLITHTMVQKVVSIAIPPAPTITGNTLFCNTSATANPSVLFAPSGFSGYAWNCPNANPNANSSQTYNLQFTSIPATVTLTVTDAMGCTNSSTITVNSYTMPLLTASVSGCSGANQPNQLQAFGAPAGSSFSWANTSGTVGTANPQAITALGTYTVIATAPNGCSAAAIITPAIGSVAAAAAPQCITSGGTAIITATSTFTNNAQYKLNTGAWQTGNTFTVTAPGAYTISAKSNTTCPATTIVTISNADPCANTSLPPLPTNLGTSAGASYRNTTVATYSVSAGSTVTISTVDISMALATATIRVANTATLTLNNVRIHGCGNYWKGIIVESGGRLIVNNSIIEDAETAVFVNNSTITSGLNILNISSSIFNKNKEAISVSNYAPLATSYPFALSNCVFTSRQLPLTGCVAPNWITVANLQVASSTTANNLASPYNLQSYPIAVLTGVTSAAGLPNSFIKLTNVGYTGGTVPTPSIKAFPIGALTTSNFNLYDGARNAVDATNSNFEIGTSVFQRCDKAVYGIRTNTLKNGTSTIWNNAAKISATLGSNTPDNSRFFDNVIGVQIIGYTWHDIKRADFRSTRVGTYPAATSIWPSFTAGSATGVLAISILSEYCASIDFQNNEIYNHCTGFFTALGAGGASYLSTTEKTFTGITEIKGNKIWDKPSGNVLTTPYCNDAVVATFNNATSLTFVNPVANPYLNIESNNIANCFRGIDAKSFNWARMRVYIRNNTIALVNENNTNALATQHGIWAGNNTRLYCASNYVTGLNPISPVNTYTVDCSQNINSGNSTCKRQANYRLDNNTKQVVTCNTSNYGFFGFEFNGPTTALGTQWTSLNVMQNAHYYGFLLNNGTVLGNQPTQPAGSSKALGNTWTYTPTGSFAKHTYTFNANAAASSFFVNSIAGGAPTLNGNTGNAGWFYKDYNPNQSIFPITATIPAGCTPEPVNSNVLISNDPTGPVVVLGGMPYVQKSTELNYMAKKYIYGAMKDDSTIAGLALGLQTFYNSANAGTSVYRKMRDIEDDINNGAYANAQTKINAFVPAIYIETNQKNFYNINLKYAQGIALLLEDSTELLRLANECPHTDGDAVYAARRLYNTMAIRAGAQYYPFTDDCNPSGFYKTTPQAQKALPFMVDLYPNPSKAGFYIGCYNTKTETVTVQINDMLGKLIRTESVQLYNGIAYIDVLLITGNYIVKISNSENETVVKKFVAE
jgi:Pregnancy-associated plasma protein-A/Secretion system C-terminal sorting domain/PKD domain